MMKQQTFQLYDKDAIDKAAHEPVAQQKVPAWHTYFVLVTASDFPGYQMVTIQYLREKPPAQLNRNKLVDGTEDDAFDWAETHLKELHPGHDLKKSGRKEL